MMTEDKNNQFVEFLCSLLNQYVFQEAKNHISDLKLYYQTNPATSGNKLCQELLGAIESYDLAAIDMPLFNSILTRTGKTGAEGQELLNKIIEYKKYSKDQVQPTLKYLKDLVASGLIRKANSLYATSPSDYIKFLKQSDVKVGEEDYLASTSFRKIDINTLIAENAGNAIPSCFDFINKSFEADGGYPRGEIVSIVAPPGVGKSLISMNEAISMALKGYKVHMLILGDLGPLDVVTRACSIWSGYSFTDSKRNLMSLYQGLCQALGDNLDLTIAPADKITIDQYVEFIKSSNKNYDVVFIDYDSNIKQEGMGDNMYLEGGKTYTALTELSIGMNKLVFILAQPKISAFTESLITINQVAESSRNKFCAF